MVYQDKIIKDVLAYLPDWRINNTRRQPKHKISAFIETDKEVEQIQYRKEITSKELLNTYKKSKHYLLAYLNRPVFPKKNVIYDALCMWTAGLLSEKYAFKEANTSKSYSLIEEAKRITKPYIKKQSYFMCISNPEFDRYKHSRCYDDGLMPRYEYYPKYRYRVPFEVEDELSYGGIPCDKPRNPCRPRPRPQDNHRPDKPHHHGKPNGKPHGGGHHHHVMPDVKPHGGTHHHHNCKPYPPLEPHSPKIETFCDVDFSSTSCNVGDTINYEVRLYQKV